MSELIRPRISKLKDKFGNKVKDENGKDKRSETSDGLTYTFVEFGTGKMVKIVLSEDRQFELYKLTKSLVLAMISSQQI